MSKKKDTDIWIVDECKKCDRCTSALLTMYSEVLADIYDIRGKTILFISESDIPEEEKISRNGVISQLTFNYQMELRNVIDYYKECEDQSCCKTFVKSIRDITVGLLNGASLEVKAVSLPLDPDPFITFFTQLLIFEYDYILEYVGCPRNNVSEDRKNEIYQKYIGDI